MTADLANPKSVTFQLSKPIEGKFSLVPVGREYDKNLILHRIKLPSIEITSNIRDGIEEAMSRGRLFVRVGDHTIMINSIAGIDPLPIKKRPEPIEGIKPMTEEQRQINIKRIAELKINLLKSPTYLGEKK